MWVAQPEWVSHEGSPVFSIDIHPDGSRVVTGGADGAIRVWNMAPLRDARMETDPSVPKVLAVMQTEATVNAVAWNPKGSTTARLASAGDDAAVSIWYLSKESATAFGGASSGSTRGGLNGGDKDSTNKAPAVNVENWTRVTLLRGHSVDVLDLAWSPDGELLASSSVDNTVIIWAPGQAEQRVKTLRGHTGLVKGLSWDPRGKYLASMSDDRTLRLWRTSDWETEDTLSTPYTMSTQRCFFRRLSWAPDGASLVTSHGVADRTSHVAPLLSRPPSTIVATAFQGHRRAVEAVAFNPRLWAPKSGLVPSSGSDSEPSHALYVALGSQDGTVSVFCSNSSVPLTVAKRAFSQSVMELAWDSSGSVLMGVSSDGGVLYMEFEDGDLGTPLTAEEKSGVLTRLYGAESSLPEGAIPEDPVPVDAMEPAAAAAAPATAAFTSALPAVAAPVAPAAPPAVSVAATQLETTTSNGKRRIQPTFLRSVGDDAGPTPVFGSGVRSAAAPAAGAGGVTRIPTSAPTSMGVRSPAPAPPGAPNGSTSTGSSQVLSTSDPRPVPLASIPALWLDAGSTAGLAGGSVEVGSKRRAGDPLVAGDEALVKRARTSADPGGIALNKDSKNVFETPVLGALSLGLKNGDVLVELCPAPGEEGSSMTVITASNASGAMLWREWLNGKAVTAVVLEPLIVVATSCAMYVLDGSGLRAAPPLILSSPVVALTATSTPTPTLAALTSDGGMTLWSVGSLAAGAQSGALKRVASLSLNGLLAAHPTAGVAGLAWHVAIGARVPSPIVRLTNGGAFAYESNAGAWACVADPGTIWSSGGSGSRPGLPGHPLRALVDAATSGGGGRAGRAAWLRAAGGGGKGGKGVSQAQRAGDESIAAAAAAIAASSVLGSEAEWRAGVASLGRLLTARGEGERLKALVATLRSRKDDAGRAAVDDVLKTMGSNAGLQRELAELKQMNATT